MQLHYGDISIRLLNRADFKVMFRWLTDERVLRYYGGRDLNYTFESLVDHYSQNFETDGFRTILQYKDIPIGYGQVYQIAGRLFNEYGYPETDRTVYAMDQFIGEPDYWNCGIGTVYLKMLCKYLKETKGTDIVLLDPHKNNHRAVRAYQKAGFKIIGELPEHELFEGKKEDCWLMEIQL